MSIKQKLKYFKKNMSMIQPLGARGFFNWMPDEQYLRLVYKSKMKKELDLSNPKTYNEKLQWLKLHDRNPLYTKLVDKYAVREYIVDTIGEKYLIPLLGVYNNVDDINWDELPEQFVLKCTHGSSTNVICTNKDELDINNTKRLFEKWNKKNWYWYGREWPYKNVKPRIIAEKFMVDKTDKELKDYKFFCFDGEPKMMFIASDRFNDTKFDFYDMEFNQIPLKQGHPNSNEKQEKPINFELMMELSAKLSKNIPHVRVDFYEVDGKVYFGELTFYHFDGTTPFRPEKYDYILGNWIKLPS